MKTLSLITVIFLFISSVVSAQTNYPSYYEQNKFNLASPGALKYGLYGYDNPAMLALQPSMDLYITWNSNNNSPDNFNNWGFFAAVPYLGFSMVNNTAANRNFNDFKISTGFGGSLWESEQELVGQQVIFIVLTEALTIQPDCIFVRSSIYLSG